MKELLHRRVLVRGLQIGRVVDVVIEPETEQVVGFEVRCEDHHHRFLPAAAATERDGTLEVDSPFALLDRDALDFYRQRGVTLKSGGTNR